MKKEEKIKLAEALRGIAEGLRQVKVMTPAYEIGRLEGMAEILELL